MRVWNEGNLECALGTMLDRNLLRGEGFVKPDKDKQYTKDDLVGYALYLHVRGGVFTDKELSFDNLRGYLNRQTKSDLREMINTRLRPITHKRVRVRGTKNAEAVSVDVKTGKQRKFM